LRKSVALISAVLFTVVIIAILGSILKTVNSYSFDFYKKIPQTSLLIKDTENILERISKEINSSGDLDMLFNDFRFASENFNVLISISPVSSKIDINEITQKQAKKDIINLLQNTLTQYGAQDPKYFIDLILDTIDKDSLERTPPSEISIEITNFPNGKIYNWTHFKKILSFYDKNRMDNSVYKIPWRKLFYFGDGKIKPVDFDRIPEEIKNALGLGENDYDTLKKDKQLKKILQNLDIITFTKNKSYLIQVDINYSSENIKLIYDINKKKAVDIENSIIY